MIFVASTKVLKTKYKNVRKCRNWQTSKTKDLVSNALVWVQVPSSAFFYFLKSACVKALA